MKLNSLNNNLKGFRMIETPGFARCDYDRWEFKRPTCYSYFVAWAYPSEPGNTKSSKLKKQEVVYLYVVLRNLQLYEKTDISPDTAVPIIVDTAWEGQKIIINNEADIREGFYQVLCPAMDMKTQDYIQEV